MKKIYIKPKMRVIDDEMFNLCEDPIIGASRGGQGVVGAGDSEERLDVNDGEVGDDAGAKGTQLWDDLSGW